MRTTLTLDDEVFALAKAQAEASGLRLGEVISALVRRGLERERAELPDGGLPSFVVREDAPVIPTTRASELLADEP